MHEHLAALLVEARRHARIDSEAEDLLQDALLEAVRAGRADVTQAVNYRWMVGTMRNLGAMQARSAVRRRLREERWSVDPSVGRGRSPEALLSGRTPDAWRRHPAVEALPSSLRDVALLALAGHDRREIGWLLQLTDTALRQRISTLRRRLAAHRGDGRRSGPDGERPAETIGPEEGALADLPLGLIRRALLPVVRAAGVAGTHDPDGHPIVLGRIGAGAMTPTPGAPRPPAAPPGDGGSSRIRPPRQPPE